MVNTPNLSNKPDHEVDVTILSGQTDSNEAILEGKRLVAIVTPAALTGANLSFQASVDGATWYSVVNTAGTALSTAMAASKWIVIAPQDFAGVSRLKIVSDASEGADRAFKLIVRELA